MKIRLQKVIANAGICSRRKAEELIKMQVVRVNGQIANIGDKADITKDVVTINNERIKLKKHEYYVINKPRKTICAVEDPQGRQTVVSLIDSDKRLFTVGRLDYDTTGLLIVTTDGEFSESITNPSSNIFKTYIAKLDKNITVENIIKLKNGVIIDKDYQTKKAKVQKVKTVNGKSYVKIAIQEGKNHQVKKMFDVVGYKVEKLTRVKIGNLTLDSLGIKNAGEYVKMRREDLFSRIK